MKQVKALSGITGYRCHLRENYSSFDEFKEYAKTYDLVDRLRFPSPESAWKANPLTEGSVNPADFRTILPYLRIYDNGNGGDRYTAVFTRPNHVLDRKFYIYVGFNEIPTSPNMGVWQHGEIYDLPTNKEWAHVGKRIAFHELPEICQRLLVKEYFNLQ